MTKQPRVNILLSPDSIKALSDVEPAISKCSSILCDNLHLMFDNRTTEASLWPYIRIAIGTVMSELRSAGVRGSMLERLRTFLKRDLPTKAKPRPPCMQAFYKSGKGQARMAACRMMRSLKRLAKLVAKQGLPKVKMNQEVGRPERRAEDLQG